MMMMMVVRRVTFMGRRRLFVATASHEKSFYSTRIAFRQDKRLTVVAVVVVAVFVNVIFPVVRFGTGESHLCWSVRMNVWVDGWKSCFLILTVCVMYTVRYAVELLPLLCALFV